MIRYQLLKFFTLVSIILFPQILAAEWVEYGKTGKYTMYYDDNLIDKLIYNYGANVKNKLLSCETIPDLKQVIQKNFQKSNKYIVSGGNQEELRFVFKKRKLDFLFNSGIFGSPDSKEKILNREIKKKENFFPALYFGDSKYDYEVAFLYKIDFIFCYEWTEFLEWKSFCYENKVKYIKNINELVVQSD